MDPINPWLDPVEVRRMAERLIRPISDPVTPAQEEAGFDSSFIGFASLTQAAVRPHSAPPPVPAAPAPAAPQDPGEIPVATVVEDPAASPTPPPSGSFLERIQKFRDWMHREFSASGVFILDRDGAVIFDESSHGRLHFLARSLAHASRKQSGSTANVHVKIGANVTLEVIPVETAYGCLVLGSVVPEPLAAAAVREVMQALNAAAAPVRTK